MLKQLVDGLNDCSNADYHADRKYLSSSVLKVLYKSLDDYHDQYILGNKQTFGNENALNEGSLVHAQILEPHNVKHDFVFYNGLRKAGADFESFKAALDPADRRTIISKPQKLRVDSYIAAFKRRIEAVEMLKGGHAEHTICGELFGVPIKVRFDYVDVANGVIYDIKTTAGPADISEFKDTIDKYRYDLSAALYLEMAEQYYKKPFTFVFIVISKQEPQVCEVYRLSEKTRSKGLAMVKTACVKYLTAKQSNIWVELKIESVASENASSNYEILEV